jgi:hypothetical protein
MKKLAAVAIASTFALASVSSFASGYTDSHKAPVRHGASSHVVAKDYHSVKHGKRHARHHHVKRHRRHV